MIGDRHCKQKDHDTFENGWRVVERTWDDRPVTKTEKRAARFGDYTPKGDREKVIAYLASEKDADSLVRILSGCHDTGVHPAIEEGVWY